MTYLFPNYARKPFEIVTGSGLTVIDNQGKEYLDFTSGIGVMNLGHHHPVVEQALAEQARQLWHMSNLYENHLQEQVAQALVGELGYVGFFCNSGAEANEGAIKLARKWGRLHRGGAHEIITFDGSFHGRTLATMSASGKTGWDTLFAPQVSGFPKARLNDINTVRSLIGPQTVAVMLEPVQGEGGVIPATPGFLQALRALTQEQGILLIVDEVQSGMGRTGRLFAYQHAGIEPDIMTLGKGIGGGVPLSALLATEAVSCFDAGDQGGTYNGNPLMTAVGIAVLRRLLVPGFMEQVEARGRYLSSRLQQLVERHALVGERGVGLLRALVLDRERAPDIVRAALHAAPTALLLNAPRPNLLRFMPALTVTEGEIDRMVELLDGLLAD